MQAIDPVRNFIPTQLQYFFSLREESNNLILHVDDDDSQHFFSAIYL